MMVLYDEEEIMRSYVESERNDAWYDSKIDTARRMLSDGTLSLDKVAEISDLPIEVIRELAEDLQLV